MTDQEPVPTSLSEARASWAFDVLAAEIARGRLLGYVPGEVPSGGTDPDQARGEIESQFSTHAISAQLDRAGCTASQQDALWFLACCEREPALGRMVEAINGGISDKPAIGFLERTFGCDVEDMLAKGMMRVDKDGNSRNRRGVQLTRCVRDVLHPPYKRAMNEVSTVSVGELAIASEAVAAARRAIRSRATVLASGLAGLGRRTLLTAVAAEIGMLVHELDAKTIVGSDDEVRTQIREFALECRLTGAAPMIVNGDALEARSAIVGAELSDVATPILVTAGIVRPRLDWGRPTIVVELSMPNTAQLAGQWLAKLGHGTPSDAQRLAEQYPLAPALIHAAAAAANARAGSNLVLADVQAGIQTVLDDCLGQYARRVRVTQSWDDIVLPHDQLDTVFELVARVRKRSKVYEQWGFAEKVGRGLGVSALFSGPPGTGKTMVASLIAKELGLELYQVDMGKVVSKFIGETEKNLGALFDAAEAGHAILLFDEADALFGKRTDVKSSNDRYANLETNYLLQRLETFTGICLLTSNHDSNIDPAFQRRLSLHLRFELPDIDEREKLWQATLPSSAPLATGINFTSLARRFEMSGGYIRNAALRAAFLAADDDSVITAAHLERAARVEYEGMGKLVA